MVTTLGATTAPPLLVNGRDVAEWLVSRNVTLRELLTVLGLFTDYGVNLNGLQEMVDDADRHFNATLEYGRAKLAQPEGRWAAPPHPGEMAVRFSRMSPEERGRLRLLATFADIGVEWSMDQIGSFSEADPGLVADLAVAIVARFNGI